MKDKNSLKARVLFFISLGVLAAVIVFFLILLISIIVDANQNIEEGGSSAGIGIGKAIILIIFLSFGTPLCLVSNVLSAISITFQKKSCEPLKIYKVSAFIVLFLSIIFPIIYIIFLKSF